MKKISQLNARFFAFMKVAFFWLACVALTGCLSAEYRKAVDSGEKPWGRCDIEMISESGEHLNAGPMNVYLLKSETEKENKDKIKIEKRRIWLEGYTEAADFDGQKWNIAFNGEKEKYTGTEVIEEEKIIRKANFCHNQIKISSLRLGSSYNYSSSPSSSFTCNDADPQIFPEFRVQLLNSKGRWFRMDLKCKLNSSGRRFK